MEVVLVRSKAPRGVLMVFHGCMRRPTDWWHYEATCVTCIGQCNPTLYALHPPPQRQPTCSLSMLSHGISHARLISAVH